LRETTLEDRIGFLSKRLLGTEDSAEVQAIAAELQAEIREHVEHIRKNAYDISHHAEKSTA
jgi:hypothetical protein